LKHHGVLQGVQRSDPAAGSRHADPVVITAYSDRSFSLVTKTPPPSYFLKKAAKIEKGSRPTGRGLCRPGDAWTSAARSRKQKMGGFEPHDLGGAAEMIKGSARSMGLQVVEN